MDIIEFIDQLVFYTNCSHWKLEDDIVSDGRVAIQLDWDESDFHIRQTFMKEEMRHLTQGRLDHLVSEINLCKEKNNIP